MKKIEAKKEDDEEVRKSLVNEYLEVIIRCLKLKQSLKMA